MDERIGVLGLGYVGLPLAVALARRYDVVGFDVNVERVDELTAGRDGSGEVSTDALSTTTARFSAEPEKLAGRNVFIIAAPTPVSAAKSPDLTPVERACDFIAPHLAPGALVILESTVYPGLTEELIGPRLERLSGLVCGRDFHLGYSPERVNPGDPKRRLETIVKVVAGQDAATLDRVAALYAPIIEAGLHRAASIKVAEAAKVIENTQRSLNISLINEFAIIFNKLGIDTEEVLAAAETKWNFLKFRPGLVGGHCIGVDPYYLTHKAQEVGYHPDLILAGQRLNDGMGEYVGGELLKALVKAKRPIESARVLLAGLTFKENCPDLRNTRAIDVYRTLCDFGLTVDVHDPRADPEEARVTYGVSLASELRDGAYDAVVFAVAHAEYRDLGAERARALLKPGGLLYDLKYIFPASASDLRL